MAIMPLPGPVPVVENDGTSRRRLLRPPRATVSPHAVTDGPADVAELRDFGDSHPDAERVDGDLASAALRRR